MNITFKRDTFIPFRLLYLLMNNYFRKCGKMSEILQKTFNVLVGSGEGVGWGSPTSSNPHSLSGSLAATLRQLALAPLKEEKELCRVQVRSSHLYNITRHSYIYIIYVAYSRPNSWTDWAEIFWEHLGVAGGCFRLKKFEFFCFQNFFFQYCFFFNFFSTGNAGPFS